jgi:hypothetical protein
VQVTGSLAERCFFQKALSRFKSKKQLYITLVLLWLPSFIFCVHSLHKIADLYMCGADSDKIPEVRNLCLYSPSLWLYCVIFQTSVPDLDPNPDPPDHMYLDLLDPDPFQSCGSGSGSGSFYYPSIIKQNSKKNLDSLCFVTSLGFFFILEKSCKCTLKK